MSLLGGEPGQGALNGKVHATTNGSLLMERYLIGAVIGDGLTAIVHEAIDTFTCNAVAVKIISRRQLKTLMLEDNIRRELKHASRLSHCNVVRLLDFFVGEENIVIVFELVQGQELYDVIVHSRHGRLKEDQARLYFIQIITAIEFIHSQGLCHRDIKPENVLVDEFDHIKLSDFGFCSHVKSLGGTKFIGSVQYMAPEVCSEDIAFSCAGTGEACNSPDSLSRAAVGESYDGQSADIWSAGVLLYVMVTGSYPFEAQADPENDELTWDRIRKGNFHMPGFVSKECQSLLMGMLRVNPAERLTLLQIRYHPFISNVQGI